MRAQLRVTWVVLQAAADASVVQLGHGRLSLVVCGGASREGSTGLPATSCEENQSQPEMVAFAVFVPGDEGLNPLACSVRADYTA